MNFTKHIAALLLAFSFIMFQVRICANESYEFLPHRFDDADYRKRIDPQYMVNKHHSDHGSWIRYCFAGDPIIYRWDILNKNKIPTGIWMGLNAAVAAGTGAIISRCLKASSKNIRRSAIAGGIIGSLWALYENPFFYDGPIDYIPCYMMR